MLNGIKKTKSASDNSLGLKFTAKAKDGINYIKLTPTSVHGHAYDLEFGRIHGLNYKVKYKFESIYCLAIPFLVEATTELSLTPGGRCPSQKNALFSALLEAAKTATKDLKLTDEGDVSATKTLSESDLLNICALGLMGVYADLYGSGRTRSVIELSNRTKNEATTVVTTDYGQKIELPKGIESDIAYVLKGGCSAYAEQLYFREREDPDFSTDEYGYINDNYYALGDAVAAAKDAA